ncbi:MAG: hydroxymethylglutaryl-CoA lyase [Bdellovibrionota bacterium]|nr:hydroxymethylglutaryl-CoA lyase [Bdellovibrionota bacterium]
MEYSGIKKNIKVVEVGPRDGLQNEKISLSLRDKLAYVDLLAATGLQTIEATSFVRADKIPQMADAVDLFKELSQKEYFDRISFPCLVPNMKGYEQASSAGVKEISLFSATSDAFTAKNINCTVDESFERMQEVADAAIKDGVKMRGYVSTAFGCPYAGEMSVDKLVHVIERFFKLGVYEVSIGDTIGVAVPGQVDKYLSVIKKEFDLDKLAMHFHDTRGMAVANCLVSLEHGISVFDSSSGGLGGCPYAKGATGNVATEDILYLFESLGLKTGINLEAVARASKFILEKVQKNSPSKYYQTIEKKL